MQSICVRAPGKVILSGEHAVGFGLPAIVLAINRYSMTTVSQAALPDILFELTALAYKESKNRLDLHALKARIEKNYQAFLKGEKSVRDILKRPFELLEYATIQFLEKYKQRREQGFHVHTESSIPIGCGMGSSAASVVSLNLALKEFLNMPLTREQLYDLSINAEHLQHGRSSGLDIYAAIHGGCHQFKVGHATKLNAPALPMWFINTGARQSPTAACIMHAKKILQDEVLREAFNTVSLNMAKALTEKNQDAFMQAVQVNHRLLCTLGVVPEKVAALIAGLESEGYAAKISGAGSIEGDAAGIVLVFGKSAVPPVIEPPYQLEALSPDTVGASVVER